MPYDLDDLRNQLVDWAYLRLDDNTRANIERAVMPAIRHGEELLYHGLGVRFPEMLNNNTVQLPADSGVMSIPLDCLQVMKFRLAGGDSEVLKKTSREVVRRVNNGTLRPPEGRPVWAIDSARIYIAPAASEATSYTMDYFQRPPYIEDAVNSVPSYFDTYYTLYFSASKWGLFRFLGDPEAEQREYEACAKQVATINKMSLLRYGAAGG